MLATCLSTQVAPGMLPCPWKAPLPRCPSVSAATCRLTCRRDSSEVSLHSLVAIQQPNVRCRHFGASPKLFRVEEQALCCAASECPMSLEAPSSLKRHTSVLAGLQYAMTSAHLPKGQTC